jgi:hypothetical protein
MHHQYEFRRILSVLFDYEIADMVGGGDGRPCVNTTNGVLVLDSPLMLI